MKLVSMSVRASGGKATYVRPLQALGNTVARPGRHAVASIELGTTPSVAEDTDLTIVCYRAAGCRAL